MKWFATYTYANPEQLRPGVNENGLRVVERIPGHPTRPAREWEINTWEQEVSGPEALGIHNAGGIVRATRVGLVTGL